MWFVDTETFKYDWLMVAINPIEKEEVVIVNDPDKLRRFYEKYKHEIWVGYNIAGYDQYIIKGLLLGFNPKEINDFIIVDKRKGWEFSSLFNTKPLIIYDTIPAIPVSLKVLEGFLGNSIHETSVPFDIDRKLTEKELEETIKYCRFDVYNTIDVFIRKKNEFDSQLALVKTFNLPLSYLGKTQAQLAAIILGAKKKSLRDEWAIRLPETLQLGKYKRVGDWFLNPDNHKYDCKLVTAICGLEHTIAWGGIHAGVSKFQYKCRPDEVILDVDVDQLYPTLMIVYHLLSRGVSQPEKFKGILETSLRLKAEGKKKEREPYKRICNITYGAEGDKFNPMYDPLHRNLVCVFGQVLIIDLLDKVEDLIQLLQSNTDGIFVKLKRSDVPEFKRRVQEWEKRTGLRMSYDEFNAMYAKDVNNYIAVREDGSYHAKGAYVKELSPLDYDLPIVNEAVKNYFLFGTPVEHTINNCNDFIKFQKIVKLSAKYEWVEHEHQWTNDEVFDNKAYRVFASTDPDDKRLLKCKRVVDKYDQIKVKKDKFGNTPDNCFVCNDDIKGASVPAKLDRDYYVNLAKKRVIDFVGE